MIVIHEKQTKDSFKELLKNNNGILIIKFGASWCGPCKQIEPFLNNFMQTMPATTTYVVVDIDESIELYGFFKSKRVLSSIPTLLMFEKENLSHIPTDLIIGGDLTQLSKILFNWQQTAMSYM